jgi:hypothetical protein
MATTTNFGWETPDDTDLVKDGALAIRTLGSAIDTSLVDLKGGTTGQVLSKTSNTDMDFTWVTSDDANAIQNAIVDAKGDLIAASAADTPARLAVGSNGDTLVADSAATTGLRWQGNYAAGKNKIINGDFNINQRGFSSTTTTGEYGFDRWQLNLSGATATYSAQTFTLGAAPVAGYEAKNFARLAATTGNDYLRLSQKIESVRTFAGQTMTVSFWAKGTNPTTAGNLKVNLLQFFGSGGSPSATIISADQTFVLTANWTRYSLTFSVPSISGKTLGTDNNDCLEIAFGQGSNASTDSWTLDIWGVQAEAGSVATAFQTATGTLQGETALCQRYYQKSYTQSTTPATNGASGYTFTPYPANATNLASLGYVSFPVMMRAAPTVTVYSFTLSSTGRVSDAGGADLAAGSGTVANNTDRGFSVYNNSGGTINFGNGGYIFHWVASIEL